MNNITLPLNNWTPRPYQLELWNALRSPNYTEYYAAWHRRAGKDEMALHDTAIRIMQRVGNYWHTMPEKDQARRAIWEGVNPKTGRRRWEDAFPREAIQKVDDKNMFLKFRNGSTWQLLGSDRFDSLVSASAVHMVFSEAALCNPQAFAILRPIVLENNGTSLYISTVRGRNHFYHQFHDAISRPKAYTTHLSADTSGVFTPEQLEDEKRALIALHGTQLGTSMFLQEYMSDWDAGEVGSVFGEEIRTLYEEKRHIPLLHDKRYPVHTFWDLGVRDNTVIIFAQFISNAIFILDYHTDTNIGLNAYAKVLHHKQEQFGYTYGYHFAPHDIEQREFTTGVSRKAEAKRLGITFTTVPRTDKNTQIANASNIFSRCYFNDPNTTQLLELLQMYRFHFNPKTRMMSKSPKHDFTSHFADAFMTLAIVAQADSTQSYERQKLRQHIQPRPNTYLLDRPYNNSLNSNVQISSGVW